MVYVIVLIVVVVLVLGGVVVSRRSHQRGVSDAPDRTALEGQMYAPGATPDATIATPGIQAEETPHDEFAGDVSDDLLDPRNPHHAAWVKEHPDMATDAEWLAEHPEDDPS
jgi:hypothetical protein